MYLLNIDGLDQVEKMHFSKKKKSRNDACGCNVLEAD